MSAAVRDDAAVLALLGIPTSAPAGGVGVRGGSGGAAATARAPLTAADALAAQLAASKGTPLPQHSSAFRLNAARLRAFRGSAADDGGEARVCPGDSVLGAVYWIHRSAAAAVLDREGVALLPPREEPHTARAAASRKRQRDEAEEWVKRQPWWPQLNAQPRTNTMCGGAPPPPLPLWYRHANAAHAADWIGVPRFFGLSHFGLPQRDKRRDGAPMSPSAVFDPSGERPLRPEQTAAVDALLGALRAWGGGFLQADCGYGKTAVILRVLVSLGVRAGVVCTQETLMAQMKADILGTPWSWPDGTPIPLAGDAHDSDDSSSDTSTVGASMEDSEPTITPTSTSSSRSTCSSSGTDVTAPTNTTNSSAAAYEGVADAVALPVQHLVLTPVGARVADVSVTSVVRVPCVPPNASDTTPTRRRRPCARYTTTADKAAWDAMSAAQRRAAAVPPCSLCGGAAADAWQTSVPPRRGWVPGVRVGWLQGSLYNAAGRRSKTCVWEDCDFIVMSAASAASCQDWPWDEFNIGALAFDEAHHVAAPTVSTIAAKTPCKYVLGVTATPERGDGLEHVLPWLLGPTAFVYKRTAAVTGVLGAARVLTLTYTRGAQQEITFRGGRLGFAPMVTALTADARRNALIVDAVKALCDAGRRCILVVSTRRDHATALFAALTRGSPAPLVPPEQAVLLMAGVAKGTLEKSRAPTTRLLVATHNYLQEGFDHAAIDTLVLTLPCGAVAQVAGRVVRTAPGKLTPLVIDIVDPWSVFAGMAAKRLRFYNSRSYALQQARDTDAWRAVL